MLIRNLFTTEEEAPSKLGLGFEQTASRLKQKRKRFHSNI